MADIHRGTRGRTAPVAVFAVVLVLCLVSGRHKVFGDPGTFWHLRLGEEFLGTGLVPRMDTLTSSRSGSPWVDQSWLFDATMAWLMRLGGWSLLAAAVAVGLAWLYAGLAMWLIAIGTGEFVAGVVALLATGIGSIHFLARPHLLTFAGVLWCLVACRAAHARGSRLLWSVPPVIAVWANIHGGFLAGTLIVAGAFVGEAVSGAWDARRRRKLAAFAATLILCLFAPMATPYGFGLYQHIAHLLRTPGVVDLIEEYQPPSFGRPGAGTLELVLLALVGLPAFSKGRPARFDLVQALIWLHLTLGSVRHAPIFGLAMAPVLAPMLDGMMTRSKDDTGTTATGPKRRTAHWPVLVTLIVPSLAILGLPMGRPDESSWPYPALPRLQAEPPDTPIFHDQDWGGLIERECKPSRLARIDDRFELWDRTFLLEYLDAIRGGPAWDRILDREDIRLVWVRPEAGLARRLLAESGWEVLHEDSASILLRRTARSPRDPVSPSTEDRGNPGASGLTDRPPGGAPR